MAIPPRDDHQSAAAPPLPRTIVRVCEEALPEEPTAPLSPILVAADGELLFVPNDRDGERTR
jgi:hypothetical protein